MQWFWLFLLTAAEALGCIFPSMIIILWWTAELSACWLPPTPKIPTQTHTHAGELLSLLSQLRRYKEPCMCFQWLVKARADLVSSAQTQRVWQQLLKAGHLDKADCTKVLLHWVVVSLCWSHSGQCLFTSHVSHCVATRPNVYTLKSFTAFFKIAGRKRANLIWVCSWKKGKMCWIRRKWGKWRRPKNDLNFHF